MVEVREASISDLKQIVDFQQKMALETEGHTLDPDVLQAGVLAILNDSAKGKYYVACMDTRPIASLMITYEWSDWRNGNIWWIQSVYVEEDYRKKGVYRAMYDHIMHAIADDPAIVGIRLYVYHDNVVAQSVYSSLGMKGGHYHVYEWIK